MKVGGVREVIIPPHLAYGAEGLGKKVPPNSQLITEIELLTIS
jgi:FKBP-type peptidyl-prolyl cis-trans isomerase